MSVALSDQKSSVDLSDPKNFQDAIPHKEFERLRNEAPVHWTPTEFGTATGGFWSLTRYADVEAATRDTDNFSNSQGICYPVNYDEPPLMVDNLCYNDPPGHGPLRRQIATAFSPRVVAGFEGWITERVRVILDGLEGRGECDLVPLVAVELPAQVICSVMGVPEDKRSQVVEWIDQSFARLRPDAGQDVARAATGDNAGMRTGVCVIRRIRPRHVRNDRGALAGLLRRPTAHGVRLHSDPTAHRNCGHDEHQVRALHPIQDDRASPGGTPVEQTGVSCPKGRNNLHAVTPGVRHLSKQCICAAHSFCWRSWRPAFRRARQARRRRTARRRPAPITRRVLADRTVRCSARRSLPTAARSMTRSP